jgi:hypothetical protein
VIASGPIAQIAWVDGPAFGAPYVEPARLGPVMRELYDAVRKGEQ